MKKFRKGFFGLITIAALSLGFATFLSNSNPSSETPIKEVQSAYNYDTYYSNAIGKTGSTLKSALRGVITNGKDTGSYGGLLTTYKTTDIGSDGYIVDMYSNVTKYTSSDNGSSASAEGQGWNREHCIPKSWWGGSTSNQGADPFIVYPTDIYVNSMRSAYPYGETSSPSKTSKNSFSKLGSSSISSYSGTVFEPNDMYKGDCARIIFYATTCYDTSSWTGNASSSTFGSYKNGLTKYAVDLFMKWHVEDPVSDWEITRNGRVYGIQKNRNPFIDNPQWANDIWGESSLVEKEDPTSITVTAASTKIAVGSTTSCTAKVLPSNASQSVTWSSSNSTVATVSSSGVVTGKSSGSAVIYATSTVDSTIKGSITINVIDIKEISLSGTPTKTVYEEGDKFNPSGLTVKATYTDNSTSTISNSSCSWLDGTTNATTLSKGTTSVICKYGNKTATYTGITVKERTTPVIEAKEIIFKKNSSDGSSEMSTLDQLKSEITSGADIISSAEMVKVFAGTNGLKFGSSSKKGSLNITLTGNIDNVTSIEVNAAKYKDSETGSFTVNGEAVTPSSSSLSTYSVSSDSTISSIDIVGTSNRFYIQSIKINTGSGGTVVPPEPVTLESLTYSGSLSKTEYIEGDTFDLSGLTFTANYSDGTHKDVTNEVTYSPKTVSLSTTSITVSYQDEYGSASVSISGFNVSEKVINNLDSLIYEGKLNKKEYYVGETFDPTGLSFYIRYTDSTPEKEVTNNVTFNKTTLSLGDTSVIATYEENGFSESVEITGITVVEKPVNNLDSLIYEGKLLKKTYVEGETFDPTGLSFYIRYTDSTPEKEVTNEVIFNKTTLSLGDTSVIATYEENGFKESVEITGIIVIEEVEDPSETPTDTPTDNPTETPTDSPTETPTDDPSDVPSVNPTDTPTVEDPSETPTTPNPDKDNPQYQIDPQVMITLSVVCGIAVAGAIAFGIVFHIKSKKKK